MENQNTEFNRTHKHDHISSQDTAQNKPPVSELHRRWRGALEEIRTALLEKGHLGKMADLVAKHQVNSQVVRILVSVGNVIEIDQNNNVHGRRGLTGKWIYRNPFNNNSDQVDDVLVDSVVNATRKLLNGYYHARNQADGKNGTGPAAAAKTTTQTVRRKEFNIASAANQLDWFKRELEKDDKGKEMHMEYLRPFQRQMYEAVIPTFESMLEIADLLPYAIETLDKLTRRITGKMPPAIPLADSATA